MTNKEKRTYSIKFTDRELDALKFLVQEQKELEANNILQAIFDAQLETIEVVGE